MLSMRVRNRNQNFRVLQFPVIIVTLMLLLQSQIMQAQEKHNYKFISPKLVAQGETFTGTVIEETPEGDVPLSKGDQLVFQGEVIDVEEDGKIEIHACFKETGSQFIIPQILRAFETSFQEEPQEMEPLHIEVLPVKADLITQIKQTSEMISDRFRVKGQGLLELSTAELVGDGKTIALDEPIASSSLELVYSIPDGIDIQPGEYTFEAKDIDGNSYKAPHPMIKPTLQLSGPPIRHRGQEGEFEIKANVDAFGEILGGEPIIEIPNRFFELQKNETKEVEFIAQQVGNYDVIVNIYDREDAPVQSDTPPVKDVNVGPIKVEHIGNKTEVTAPINVIDNNGEPIKEVTVDIAISYPDGVEYTRIITDEEGSAAINHTLMGELVVADLSILAYNVLGHFWQVDNTDVQFDLGLKPGIPKKLSRVRLWLYDWKVVIPVKDVSDIHIELRDKKKTDFIVENLPAGWEAYWDHEKGEIVLRTPPRNQDRGEKKDGETRVRQKPLKKDEKLEFKLWLDDENRILSYYYTDKNHEKIIEVPDQETVTITDEDGQKIEITAEDWKGKRGPNPKKFPYNIFIYSFSPVAGDEPVYDIHIKANKQITDWEIPDGWEGKSSEDSKGVTFETKDNPITSNSSLGEFKLKGRKFPLKIEWYFTDKNGKKIKGMECKTEFKDRPRENEIERIIDEPGKTVIRGKILGGVIKSGNDKDKKKKKKKTVLYGRLIIIYHQPPESWKCKEWGFIQHFKRTVEYWKNGKWVTADTYSTDGWELDEDANRERREGEPPKPILRTTRDGRVPREKMMNDGPGLENPWGKREDVKKGDPSSFKNKKVRAKWEFRTWVVCTNPLPIKVQGFYEWGFEMELKVGASKTTTKVLNSKFVPEEKWNEYNESEHKDLYNDVMDDYPDHHIP